jgi:hypothetical protein
MWMRRGFQAGALGGDPFGLRFHLVYGQNSFNTGINRRH